MYCSGSLRYVLLPRPHEPFLTCLQYIAPLIGSFNIVCLAARNSAWVSWICGGAEANEGMGLGGIGLDWASASPFFGINSV